MLTISMENIDGITKALDGMQKQIDAIPDQMFTELDDWQTEDVKFKVPYTKRVDENTSETLIWPRGRRPHGRQFKSAKGRRSLRKLSAKKLNKRTFRRNRSKAIANFHGGQRPLLRESLYDKLVGRMNALLEKVEWQ
jgi:hypothetical protein